MGVGFETGFLRVALVPVLELTPVDQTDLEQNFYIVKLTFD